MHSFVFELIEQYIMLNMCENPESRKKTKLKRFWIIPIIVFWVSSREVHIVYQYHFIFFSLSPSVAYIVDGKNPSYQNFWEKYFKISYIWNHSWTHLQRIQKTIFITIILNRFQLLFCCVYMYTYYNSQSLPKKTQRKRLRILLYAYNDRTQIWLDAINNICCLLKTCPCSGRRI